MKIGIGEKIALGFLLLISLGTMLLLLPMSTSEGVSISFTDAVFTSTSAVCVTGLIVKNTGGDFSLFGQAVILLLIQCGGIGITFGSALVLLGFRGKISLEGRMELQKTFINWPFQRVKKALKRVFVLFFVVEAIGAVVFVIGFSRTMSVSKAIWNGIFHSISATCNAGFSLFRTSFSQFGNDPIVVITATVLIVFGGLGFVVVAELFELASEEKGDRTPFSLHTRVMLYGSLVLIALGTTGFWLLEPDATVLESFFQAVTPRTAGFNTVDLTTWSNASLILLMGLMFIGGGPASTAGGIKITTAAVTGVDLWTRLRKQKNVHLLDRRIPEKQTTDSVLLTACALLVVGLFLFLLTITEDASLKVLLFEVFSALGTVGLSLGITPDLSPSGKWIIIISMFLGRLGPLTFAYLVIQKERQLYTYPEEHVIIG